MLNGEVLPHRDTCKIRLDQEITQRCEKKRGVPASQMWRSAAVSLSYLKPNWLCLGSWTEQVVLIGDYKKTKHPKRAQRKPNTSRSSCWIVTIRCSSLSYVITAVLAWYEGGFVTIIKTKQQKTLLVFQLLECEDVLLLFALRDSKLNMLRFWDKTSSFKDIFH